MWPFSKIEMKKVNLINIDGTVSENWKAFLEKAPIWNECQEKTVLESENNKIKYGFDSGTKGEAILFLPGTTGTGKIWFEYAQSLSDKHRILLPDAPVVCDIVDFCERLFQWVNDKEIDSMVLVGQGFGGVIAQVFADMYPEKVKGLVLMLTVANTKYVESKVRLQYKRGFRRFLKALDTMKFEKIQKSLYKRIMKGIDIAYVDDKPFWKGFYGNIFLESSQEQIRAMHEMQNRFWEQMQAENAKWKGPVLRIEASTKKRQKSPEKEGLSSRYPNAQQKTIEGSSNMAHIREKDRLCKLIREFVGRI